MAVDQNRRFAGRVEPVAVNNGMTTGLHHFDVFDAGLLHPLHHPLAGLTHIRRVFGQAGDTGNAQEIEQLFEKARTVCF